MNIRKTILKPIPMTPQMITLCRLTTLICFLLCGVLGYSQAELKGLSITKQNELSKRTNLDLIIPVEAGQTFFRLNMTTSEVKKLQDDTGFDFLTARKGFLVDESYASFDGYDSQVNLRLSFEGVPAKGAKTLHLTGTFILELQKEGSQVASTKLRMPGSDSKAVTSTEFGDIEVWASGSASTDEVEYLIFHIEAPLPVKSVKVLSGDDSAEVSAMGIGLEADQFVFKNEPEEIEVEIVFAQIEYIKIPVDLSFGIGF